MSKKNSTKSTKEQKKRKNDFPVGRTFFTNDKFLPHKDKNAYKDVDVVAIEKNNQGEMIVVRVTTQQSIILIKDLSTLLK